MTGDEMRKHFESVYTPQLRYLEDKVKQLEGTLIEKEDQVIELKVMDQLNQKTIKYLLDMLNKEKMNSFKQ